MSKRFMECDAILRGPGYEQNTNSASASWSKTDTLAQLAMGPADGLGIPRGPLYYDRGSILVGLVDHEADDPAGETDSKLVGWKDDRHAVTVAGSRGGKGVSAIIPNLQYYPGSILCIDPKGENAAETAEKRNKAVAQGGLGQGVFVLDPFDVSGVDPSLKATFNPLDLVQLHANDFIEQVASIADSLVVASGPRNAHWDESARGLIEALIVHVLTGNMRGRPKSLATVRELLMLGDRLAAEEFNADLSAEHHSPAIEFPSEVDYEATEVDTIRIDPWDALIEELVQNETNKGFVSGHAQKLISMGEEERGSVMSFAQRHTKFLESDAMRMAVSRSLRNLDIDQLKKSKKGISVYLCLPVRYMSTHARWLRLVLNSAFVSVERIPGKCNCGVPALAVLDEFPVLGNLRSVENAIGYVAGFDLLLWVFLQDLSQLKRDYPKSWETFLGNASMKQFFSVTDMTTLQYLSDQLGETEFRRELVDESKSVTTGAVRQSTAQTRKERSGSNERNLLSQQDQITTTDNIRTEVIVTKLMRPDELALYLRRENENQLLFLTGHRPMILRRVLKYELGDKADQFITERNRIA